MSEKHAWLNEVEAGPNIPPNPLDGIGLDSNGSLHEMGPRFEENYRNHKRDHKAPEL